MDRTCKMCVYYHHEPGSSGGYGVCFKKHVFDGYGWTKSEKTCGNHLPRFSVRNGKDPYCTACGCMIDESDRFCRHCGIEFTRGKR